MIKTNPGHRPTTKPPITEPEAAPVNKPAPAKNADPLATVETGDEQDQGESSTRRAHRLRMKDLFSRAAPAC